MTRRAGGSDSDRALAPHDRVVLPGVDVISREAINFFGNHYGDDLAVKLVGPRSMHAERKVTVERLATALVRGGLGASQAIGTKLSAETFCEVAGDFVSAILAETIRMRTPLDGPFRHMELSAAHAEGDPENRILATRPAANGVTAVMSRQLEHCGPELGGM